MGELSLQGEWKATWADGLHGKSAHALSPVLDPRRYFTMHFPASIHSNLEDIGIVQDPKVGINSLQSRWVEEHYWILRREFSIPVEAVNQSPRLIIEILDGVAQISINGVVIGTHANSHRPAVFELDYFLKPGKNELVIRLESGLFKVADLPGGAYSLADETTLTKRHHLRQPQYQFGWDWNPRLVFFGIHGDMRIQWGDQPRIDQVSITNNLSDRMSSGEFIIDTHWFVPGEDGASLDLLINIDTKPVIEQKIELNPGHCSTRCNYVINSPNLWYPAGYGEQHLYLIEIVASQDGIIVDRWSGYSGIRKVEIIQNAHPVEGNFFHLVVNDVPIFCKGANWVPPEMSAFEVSTEKIEELVDLAIDQNFNMLRIWGGGIWAGHELLELCDQKGIMVWHDLLFACSKYPGDNPQFLLEVQKEIAWGFGEFSPHPSLVVWCGNNELEWGLWSWNYQDFGVTAPDYVLFHNIIPNLLAKIDPYRPYWPSSPYTGGEFEPNDPTRGDQHPWDVSIGDTESPEDIWKYRQFVDRFPNEGGVLGLSPLKSLSEFLPGESCYARSFAWEHHDNTVNFWKNRIGVTSLMIEDWFGVPVDELSLEQQVLASGLVQAEGLKEYIRNYRRRWPSSAAAVYWDYTDSWPSIHGWGTIDYYLRRKPSYYTVKRANRPIIVVLGLEKKAGENSDEHEIVVVVSNETEAASDVKLIAGKIKPTGDQEINVDKIISVSGRTCFEAARIEMDDENIAFAVIFDQEDQILDWDRMLLKKIKHFQLTLPRISVVKESRNGKHYARYSSDQWVWDVILDIDGEAGLSDNIFDLLPGIPYTIELKEGKEPFPVITTGNALLNEVKKML